ncbi:lipopolysaccharide biosynthesis protein [Pectobacterium versatile]|uniref:lipopolysaccharide biosynthesis protein n=1 Tax=Pectobacterium versatile TaxID=2488639 RepID=UPI001F1CD5E5|nr:oligosaccharide flippase family protein [Pectobacterium versatile]
MYKNMSLAVFFKIISAILGFVTVPILMKTIGVENYGLWAALVSVLGTIALFDFGLGQTLKNSIAEYLAREESHNVKKEILLNLFLAMKISVVILICFFILFPMVDIWKDNAFITILLYSFFILTFPLSMGNMILQGSRDIGIQSAITVIAPLLFILFLYLFPKDSIQSITLIYIISFFISYFFLWFFILRRFDFKITKFNSSILKEKLQKEKINTSLNFFVIQLSSLILYSIGTFIVINAIDKTSAAYYDSLNKIFLFAMSLFNIGVAVFWPEVTRMKTLKNFQGIFKIYKVMLALSIFFSLGVIFLAYITPTLGEWWLGDFIKIRREDAYFFAALSIVQSLAYAGAVILNAFEDIRIQTYLSVISIIIMYPLCKFFIALGMGMVSIPFSAMLITLIPMIYCNFKAIYVIKNGTKEEC